MKNKIINLIVIICLIITLIGCNKEPYKEIIIDEDVNVDNTIAAQAIATGQIQLKLEKEAIFHPLYYLMGEIYGYIGMGDNISKTDKIRRYIYKIDRLDNIEETSREYINFLRSQQNTQLEIGVATITDDKEHNVPGALLDLNYRVNKLKEKNANYSYEVSAVIDNNDFVIIREKDGNSREKVYIYDNKDKNFYSPPSNDIKNGEICYVKALDSLIWVDQEDFKIYKIIFKSLPFYLKEGFFSLEEYIDLSIVDKVDRVRVTMKNKEEMILFQDMIINNKGIYEDDHLYETNLVTKFDFSTNKYDYVYGKPTVNHIYIEYLGHNIFSVEGFDLVDDAYIISEFRRIFRMASRVVNLVYQEEFKEKSEQFYPTNEIIINKDGREVFSTRTITYVENNKEIIRSVIYQRIDISNEKLGDRND